MNLDLYIDPLSKLIHQDAYIIKAPYEGLSGAKQEIQNTYLHYLR